MSPSDWQCSGGGEVLSVHPHCYLLLSPQPYLFYPGLGDGLRDVLPWCLLSADMCVIGALRRQEPPGQCSWQILQFTEQSVYPSLDTSLSVCQMKLLKPGEGQ